ANLCRRLGLKVNVASKIAESSIAAAAAVHLACAIPASDWGVSLTHFYLAEDLVKQPLPLGEGMVALPAGPGRGVGVGAGTRRRWSDLFVVCIPDGAKRNPGLPHSAALHAGYGYCAATKRLSPARSGRSTGSLRSAEMSAAT